MNKVVLERIANPDDKRFIKKIMEYNYKAEMQYRPFFTDFYNKEWMTQLLKQYLGIQSNFYFFGGHAEAERQMLGIAPFELEGAEFPIMCLKIEVKTGIGKPLSHRDFLGALLGLGIERDAIGDIIIKPFGAYIIVEEAIGHYIRAMLTSIARYQNIEITEIEYTALDIDPPITKEIRAIVSSLRLDAVIAAGFGLSRSICVKLIQGDKVKCNGISLSAKSLVKEGDYLTVRGYGKLKLAKINGTSKKDRLHITIEKYI